MIKLFTNMTVVKTCIMFFLTVFFSASLAAQDSALINLEFGLNELVYDVARTIVTVEASEPIYPQNYQSNQEDAIYTLISTGLIYDTSGYVIAPAESVSKYASIYIRFDDKSIRAKKVAIDYQNGIALLKLEKPYGWPIRLKAQTGCAGQMILAVGNSYGVRAAPALGICAGYRPDGMMQFSASFTSSTHGGGLFSMDGKLLGMITAPIGNSSEIGLAIPAYKIPDIVNYLKTEGDKFAGYIGLVTREIEISPPIQVYMHNSSNQHSISAQESRIDVDHGLLVEKVAHHSPAYKAGLKKGDLLFQANSLSIDDPLEFANYIRKTTPGTEIEFDFLRHNAVYQVKIPIGKQTQFASVPQKAPFGNKSDLIADSILKEIHALREHLQSLENRLKQLR